VKRVTVDKYSWKVEVDVAAKVNPNPDDNLEHGLLLIALRRNFGD
jgi:hypothetical protein